MTKGKYAARATRRREDQGVQSEIEAYQHHVKRLTAENRELTGKLAADHAARTEEVRRLKAQLDEGLSLEMIALRGELEQQRQRTVQAEAAQRKAREIHQQQVRGLVRVLTDGLGLTHVEAWEVMAVVDPDFQTATAGDYRYALMLGDSSGTHPGRLSKEQIYAIQAAKGKRHGTDVVKFLRDRLDAAVARAEQPE